MKFLCKILYEIDKLYYYLGIKACPPIS